MIFFHHRTNLRFHKIQSSIRILSFAQNHTFQRCKFKRDILEEIDLSSTVECSLSSLLADILYFQSLLYLQLVATRVSELNDFIATRAKRDESYREVSFFFFLLFSLHLPLKILSVLFFEILISMYTRARAHTHYYLACNVFLGPSYSSSQTHIPRLRGNSKMIEHLRDKLSPRATNFLPREKKFEHVRRRLSLFLTLSLSFDVSVTIVRGN